MILETIDSPNDVRQLSLSELDVLSGEIREFLIQSVAQTGGHLSSNLGAVELTIALHRVFDTLEEPLVFDVGHQAYVHKILTGRKDQFYTLRQFEGLSGFPKPYESDHDAFVAGHASNSVSVALGMARAKALQGNTDSTLALIGDGSLSGGLAYEGLNDAGGSGLPLVVILNDNGMSIQPNVGGMHRHLGDLRCQPSYYHFKKWYRSLFGKEPQKNPLYRQIHQVKTSLKRAMYPKSSLFEDMGFVYLGPVDGHDIQQLTQTFDWARKLQCPVLVHVKTIKGKGYAFAQENPGKYHGVAPFNPETGETVRKSSGSFSGHFGQELLALGTQNPAICAITAAMGDSTGLTPFATAYPERFFDVAIAEGHAVSMAAGLCKAGMRPVFAVYSTFLQRGYDMLFHDVALQNLPVVFAVDRAGLVGADGETHHGCLDVQYLCQIPNFTVLCPSNYAEQSSMLAWALTQNSGPVAIRYPRGGQGDFTQDTGLSPAVALGGGDDVTLVGYGMIVNHLLEAAEMLEKLQIHAKVVKLNRIAPLCIEDLEEALGNQSTLVVVEDCFGAGCVGQRIGAILTQHSCGPKRLILKNLGQNYAPQGSVAQLEHTFGLDATSIVQTVMEEIT